MEKMVARIFPPGSEYDFQVEVIDSDWVNAVAFPGGKILISHGLLEKSPSADAVAGVLAHVRYSTFYSGTAWKIY